MVRALVPRVVNSSDALRPVSNLEKALAILLLGRVSGSKEALSGAERLHGEQGARKRSPGAMALLLALFI